MNCRLCYQEDCRQCADCHQPECTHHAFVPIIPTGFCNCIASDWYLGAIPPVCDMYFGDGEEYCERCEHNKECHQLRPEEPK